MAGPVQQVGGGGYFAMPQPKEAVNHASVVADYDFGVDNDTHEELKFEMVSHVCSAAV